MRKKLIPITSLIVVGILVTGCNSAEVDDTSNKTSSNSQTSNEEKSEDEKSIDEKAWKDITTLYLDEGKYDFPTNVKDWIASENKIYNEEPIPDPDGLDKYWGYENSAHGTQATLEIIKVQGVAIEKDFDNIWMLAEIIQEEQSKRTEHINPDHYDKFDPNQVREAKSEAKEPNDRLIKAVEYMKQLLNDLDIAINKDGKGEPFGVAHQLDGQRVGELETFIRGDE